MNKNSSMICSDYTAMNNAALIPALIPSSVLLPQELQMHALYERITKIFMTIGIPAHVSGYYFLREAIRLAVGNFEMIKGITKKLYPLVASRFNTSAGIVERSIRNAIVIACNNNKIINLNILFGAAIFERNYRPSNGELIALLAEKVYLDCIK